MVQWFMVHVRVLLPLLTLEGMAFTANGPHGAFRGRFPNKKEKHGGWANHEDFFLVVHQTNGTFEVVLYYIHFCYVLYIYIYTHFLWLVNLDLEHIKQMLHNLHIFCRLQKILLFLDCRGHYQVAFWTLDSNPLSAVSGSPGSGSLQCCWPIFENHPRDWETDGWMLV